MNEDLPPIDFPMAVREGGAAILRAVTAVHTRSTTIRSGWQGLAHSYEAPESATVLAAMDKPMQFAATFQQQATSVKSALDAYADELETLQRERSELMDRASQWNADMRHFTEETASFTGGLVHNFLGTAESDLMDRGQQIQGDMDAWKARCDAAQRTCANAIRALFGAPALKAADRSTVAEQEAGTVFGLSADGYHAQTQSGSTPWFDGQAWNGVTWAGKTIALGDGAVGSVTQMWDFGVMVTGHGEEGEREAFLSGMKHLGWATFVAVNAQLTYGSFDTTARMTPEERAEYLKAKGVLDGVVDAAWSRDTWGATGWRTAGGFAPDVIGAIATAGAAVVGKSAIRAGVKGVLGGALRAGVRVAPKTAMRISRLAVALDAMTLPGGRLNKGLTAVRNASLRVEDARARVDAIKAAMWAAPGKAGAAAFRSARRGLEDFADGLSPQLAPARGGRIPRPPRPEHPGMMERGTTDKHGWTSTGVRPTDHGTRRFLEKSLPPVADQALDTRPGRSNRFLRSDMRVRPDVEPPAERVFTVDLKGQHSDLYPKVRETFGEHAVLKPNAAYEVRGRGTFFTGVDGKVNFVVVERRSFSLTGNALKRELMSSDLRRPLPDTTYVIDGTYFHVNAEGQTDHVYVPELSMKDVARSAAAQRVVAGGVENYDAGHLQAREHGGAREEINLVQMWWELNQGKNGRSLASMDSWRHIELELNKVLGQGRHMSLDVRPENLVPGRRPDLFEVTATDSHGNIIVGGTVRNA